MDTHQTTKPKTDDTEKRKRKLLTFKEFLTINDPICDPQARSKQNSAKEKLKKCVILKVISITT